MRILLVKNRIKGKLNLERGVEWFVKNTPLKFKFTEIETDFDFVYQDIGNGKAKGVIPKATSINPQLRRIVKEGEYDVVCVFIGNKVSGIRVSNAYKSQLYKGTRVLQTYKHNDGGLTWNHELIHSLFMLLADKGVVLDDPMDTVTVNGVVKHYYNNKNLDAKVSNRTIALERLSPHWHLLCK